MVRGMRFAMSHNAAGSIADASTTDVIKIKTKSRNTKTTYAKNTAKKALKMVPRLILINTGCCELLFITTTIPRDMS